MKNLKSIMLGLALLVVCGAAQATEPAPSLTKNYVIHTYIYALAKGQLTGMGDIVDENAKFSLLRGKQILSFSKGEVMDNLKLTKNVVMDCTINTSVIESTPDFTLVKVDMKFTNFVRSNYITLVNTGAGWKITNVYSVFK
ncbi:MAG: hypothetical protein JWR67_3993 [Mucilaginibacter sp.]|nr:hypothetical protein [Mucilaginibacter sp.]